MRQQSGCAGPVELLTALLELADGESAAIISQFPSLCMMQGRIHVDSIPRDDSPGPLPDFNDLANAYLRRARELAVAFNRFELAGSTELLIALLETPGEILPAADHEEFQPLVEQYHARRQPPKIELEPEDEECDARIDDVARILDANLNRGREAVRVLEDYARFILDDKALVGQMKECRHAYRTLAELLSSVGLIEFRDTMGDVGTTLETAQEMARDGVHDVLVANLKRAQEAMRVIEEFGKLVSEPASRLAKDIRYKLYSLEKILISKTSAHDRLSQASLYWLCDSSELLRPLAQMVFMAAEGGVEIVQLRDKQAPDRDLLALARQLRALTRERGLLFIVNDRPDIARLSEADGVHVGQEELSARDARRIMGPGKLVGVSTHSIEQARQAVLDGADYLGVGPVFASRTKQFESLVGVSLVREVAAEIKKPFFAIGGIDSSNVDQVAAAGATRIALGSALTHSGDPTATARKLREALNQNL